MKQIKLLFLLASASVTGAFAQSHGLTDMSQSRYAKMANTGIDAVHWTNGFWGERFNVFSGTSLQSMWTLIYPPIQQYYCMVHSCECEILFPICRMYCHEPLLLF